MVFFLEDVRLSERIQKVLARLGLGSRRKLEVAIQEGRIKVNNKVAKLGDRIAIGDKVTFDGKKVTLSSSGQELRIVMYHKPVGQVVTRHDPEGRETVFSALPEIKNGRWVNVGRLDINTSGLLLFTNDGDLANRLMHPSSGLDREYAVRVFGDITSDKIKRLVKGVKLDDGWARFEDVVDSGGQGANRWLHVVVAEGRNRIVRRLFESQDCQVSRLMRVRFGPIMLPDNLVTGRCKDLSVTMRDQLLRPLMQMDNKNT